MKPTPTLGQAGSIKDTETHQPHVEEEGASQDGDSGSSQADPQGSTAQGLPAAEQGLGAACPSSLQPGAECPSPTRGAVQTWTGGWARDHRGQRRAARDTAGRRNAGTIATGETDTGYRSRGTREKRSGGAKSGLLRASRLSPLSSWGSVSAIPTNWRMDKAVGQRLPPASCPAVMRAHTLCH